MYTALCVGGESYVYFVLTYTLISTLVAPFTYGERYIR